MEIRKRKVKKIDGMKDARNMDRKKNAKKPVLNSPRTARTNAIFFLKFKKNETKQLKSQKDRIQPKV